jgi:hypothetical protein
MLHGNGAALLARHVAALCVSREQLFFAVAAPLILAHQRGHKRIFRSCSNTTTFAIAAAAATSASNVCAVTGTSVLALVAIVTTAVAIIITIRAARRFPRQQREQLELHVSDPTGHIRPLQPKGLADALLHFGEAHAVESPQQETVAVTNHELLSSFHERSKARSVVNTHFPFFK